MPVFDTGLRDRDYVRFHLAANKTSRLSITLRGSTGTVRSAQSAQNGIGLNIR